MLGLINRFFGLMVPGLAGNIVGGSGLFALLAYAQVHEKLQEDLCS